MIVTSTTEIKPELIADLMITVMEGGCGYWCSRVELIKPELVPAMPWYSDESLYYDESPLLIEVWADNAYHAIGLPQFNSGFMLMQNFGEPRGFHWRDLLAGNWDATTADVWFQLAVFGEVVYA